MQWRKCEQFYKLSRYECEGKFILFKSNALLNLNMYSQTDVDNKINNILSTLNALFVSVMMFSRKWIILKKAFPIKLFHFSNVW